MSETERVEMVYIVIKGMTMLVPQSFAESSRPKATTKAPPLRPAGTLTKRVISVEPDLPPVVLQTMMGEETTAKPEDMYSPPPLKRVKKELSESREADVSMGEAETNLTS